jgi:type IV pilus assembly protein PilA
MAIAMPIYLSAVADSKLKTCRSNLQTIANAVQAARVKVRGVDYAAVIVGGVTTTNLENLHVIPLCPEAGAYSLTNGSDGDATTFRVTCSHGTHGGFEPGVDSN